MSMELLNDVGHKILDFLKSEYQNDQGIHAETLIGALAAITGDQLLRRVVDVEKIDGESWIQSDGVNEEIEGQEGRIGIYQMLCAFAEMSGADKESFEPIENIFKRTVEGIGQGTYPPLTIDKENYPLEYSPNAAVRYRTVIRDIIQENSEEEEDEYDYFCAHALGMLIYQTQSVVDPRMSLQLAIEIVVGVSKMNIIEEL